jgi:hypothetical protein
MSFIASILYYGFIFMLLDANTLLSYFTPEYTLQEPASNHLATLLLTYFSLSRGKEYDLLLHWISHCRKTMA